MAAAAIGADQAGAQRSQVVAEARQRAVLAEAAAAESCARLQAAQPQLTLPLTLP